LFAQALIPLLARAFYARHNTMSPFYAALAGLIVNAAVSWLLIKKIGVLGLAAGFSAGSIANFAALFVLLRLKVKSIGASGLLSFLLKISLASLLMAVAAQYIKTYLGGIVDMQKFWGIAVQATGAALAGLIVFIGAGLLLKSEELLNFIAGLRRHLWREVKVEKEGMTN
jgi:putative peptidoglycan lipid II flippase